MGGDPFENNSIPRVSSPVEEVLEKPDGLDEITWARVLEARANKIANEQDLKRRYNALTELIKVLTNSILKKHFRE